MATGTQHEAHRTWFQRLAIGSAITASIVAALAAVGLTAGYVVLQSRQVVSIENPAEAAEAVGPTETPALSVGTTAAPTTQPADDAVPGPAAVDTSPATTTPPTFPEADDTASNFLLTGADNGACIDPDSPYAPAFGDRENMGERSDTIMVLRVDPTNDRLAILSFPRDLYVDIAGTGNRARINSAFRRDEPQRLIDTIYENFGVGVDHFIQVDFCAFKTLVDAVGGVTVPFTFAARDASTGLNVPAPGCFRFGGEHALAYVRSRHYEYEDPPGSGDWRVDGTSDLGRISRQQDFLRRVLARVLSAGPLNPSVVGGLIESAQNYVVTDDRLSPARLLEFAGVLNDVNPASIPTYQIESSPRTIGGADVQVPEIDGDNMQAILDVFRGETSLGEAPAQSFETTTLPVPSVPPATPATTSDDESPSEETATESGTAPATTVDAPIGDDAPAENTTGIIPPRDVVCD